MSDQWRLLADVGGTNVRFGVAREQRSGRVCDIEEVRSWPSETFPNFETALEQYLATLGNGFHLSSVAVAAAGPAERDTVALTNRNWVITKAALHRVIQSDIPARLYNDLAAVAHALPFLRDDAIDWLDAVRPPGDACGRQLAINVGTGFGSATIIRGNDGWISCPAESGHMQLGCSNAREQALFAGLALDEPTVEDLLSGDGVRRLRDSMVMADRRAGSTRLRHGSVFDFSETDSETTAVRAMFAGLLARHASNLVLASAAWDGVFLCGSVAMAWSPQADRRSFRHTFAGTSKMQERLAETPIGFIRHAYPALLGLANCSIAENP